MEDDQVNYGGYMPNVPHAPTGVNKALGNTFSKNNQNKRYNAMANKGVKENIILK